MIISEEPYSALMLLFNLNSGKFMSRVWNQTVSSGEAFVIGQFVEACQRHFLEGGRPCVGCIQGEDEQVAQEYHVSHTPVPRKVSKECNKFLGKDAQPECRSCRECLKINDLRVLREMGAAVNCKVEILSEEEAGGEKVSKRKRKRPREKYKREYDEDYEEEEPLWEDSREAIQ